MIIILRIFRYMTRQVQVKVKISHVEEINIIVLSASVQILLLEHLLDWCFVNHYFDPNDGITIIMHHGGT